MVIAIVAIKIVTYAGISVQFPKIKKDTYPTERHGPYPRKSFSKERSIDWVSHQSSKRSYCKGNPKPNSNNRYISL